MYQCCVRVDIVNNMEN